MTFLTYPKSYLYEKLQEETWSEAEETEEWTEGTQYGQKLTFFFVWGHYTNKTSQSINQQTKQGTLLRPIIDAELTKMGKCSDVKWPIYY